MAKKQVNIGGIGPMPIEGPPVAPDFGRPMICVPKNPIDNWDKATNNLQRCETCMHYVGYRCRRHAPKGQEGWPAVFPTDWCGDHKMSKGTMAERA